MKIKALALLVFGVVLIVLAFVIFSGGTDIVSIDSNKLNSDANGQLVYVQGQLKPRGALEDQLFGIAERDAIGLKRVVELYQYKKSESGELTPIWSEEIITLDSLPNNKPLTKWVESVTYSPNEYALGVYNLSSMLQAKVTASNWEPVPFTPEQYNALPSSGKRAFKLYEGKLYYGLDPEQPRIGDMYISFERAIQNVSIVAQLSGGQLIPDTETGNNIHVLRNGSVSKDDLIENLDLPSGLLRLIVLGVGFIVALLGGFLFLKNKGSAADGLDDNEFAELDSDEFTADGSLPEQDLNDESETPNSLDEQSQPLPEDLGAMAANIASGAGIQPSSDSGEDHYAPMETPGMEESFHDDLNPLDDVGDDAPLPPQETPMQHVQADESEALAFEEPAMQDPQPQQDEHFAVDDMDGLDFDLNDDIQADEQAAPDASVDATPTANTFPEKHAETEPVADDSDTEAAPKVVSDDSSWTVDEAQADSTLSDKTQSSDAVEPLSEDGFDNQSYEDDVSVSDEMFLLDDEQDEGGSEPQEVDSADSVASSHTEFEHSISQTDAISDLEPTFTESNAEQPESNNLSQNNEDILAEDLNSESVLDTDEGGEHNIATGQSEASNIVNDQEVDEDFEDDEDSLLLDDDDDDDDDFLFLDDDDEEFEDDEDSLLLDDEDDDDEHFELDETSLENNNVDDSAAVDTQPVSAKPVVEDNPIATQEEDSSLDDELDDLDTDWDFDDIQAIDDSDEEVDDSDKKNKDKSAADIQEF